MKWSLGARPELPDDHPGQAWNFFALPSDASGSEERKRQWLSGAAFKGHAPFARYDMAMTRERRNGDG